MKNNSPGMSLIVKTITRLTVGLILIYGIYIALEGHAGPGSGFAGGVIIALSLIHLMLAFGKDEVLKTLSKPQSVFLASAGAGLFLLITVLKFFSRHNLFARGDNFKLFNTALLPLSDIFVALMTGAGLFAIFLSLVLLLGEKDI